MGKRGTKPRTAEQMRQHIKNSVTVRDNGCWEWQKARDWRYGYGVLKWARESRKETQAHRVSYTAFIGEIPEGAHILHSCDNPLCCNPEHLRVGSNSENVQDKVSRGRQQKGEEFPQSKLTEDAVRHIRRRYAQGGISQRALGEEYGVSAQTVSNVIRRKKWKHVD